jgi:hypothetical protein
MRPSKQRSETAMRKLSRKTINEGLDTIPIAEILGVSPKAKGLTHKQQTFARELAKGSTKAEAYRKAYKPTATQATLSGEPYRVASDPRISAEVEAYKVAIESAKHRTPEALRQLVIKTLVDVAISPDAKDAVKVQAVKVLGTVVEVGAFLERREVINTSSSAQAKADLLAQIRTLMQGNAVDAIEVDADSLLRELAPEVETLPADTHPTHTPHDAEAESQGDKHTIPLKQFQNFPDELDSPTQEDPPYEKFD